MIDAVEHLARDDKWQLGAGDGALFAPPHPQWLDTPGFWDAATFLDVPFGPLFTVAVLDDDGNDLPIRATARRWTPAEVTLQYRVGQGLTATEVRSVHPGGVFVSEWRFAAFRPTRIHLVAWTAQDSGTIEGGSLAFNGALSFIRSTGAAAAKAGTTDPLLVHAELGCAGGADSWCALRTERGAFVPRWGLTPFVEKWRGGALPRTLPADAGPQPGALYAAVHRALSVEYAGAAVTFAMRLVPADASLRGAESDDSAPPRHGTFGAESRRRWGEYFAARPEFHCSDPYFETLYWYRWYGLRLNGVSNVRGNWGVPAVCEGPGELHRLAADAAPTHARELRWHGDPAMARGALRAFFAHQHRDGSLPAHVGFRYTDPARSAADWGDALLAVDDIWPDDRFLKEIYPALAKFAEWLVKSCDAAATGMFDLVPAIGDAAMLAVRAPAGRGDDASSLRLKGIDATTSAYRLFRALESLAPRAGARGAKPTRWQELADRTCAAVRDTMWDPAAQLFSDVDAATGIRTGVRTALCFLPYGTDLTGPEHVAGIERHLLDPREFGTAYPVPTLAVADPRFSADGESPPGGRRLDHPHNGRAWPSLNCRVVDALAATARAHKPELRHAAAALLRRTSRMLFHGGELHRPNSYEHYNPLTGHAAVHSGIDDVQQGWIIDLLLRQVMGVQAGAAAVVIDPLPCGLEHAEVRGLKVRGHLLDVIIEGDRVTVQVDGTVTETQMGSALDVTEAFGHLVPSAREP